MLVYALIPARSGSKGVPHKNIRPISGHPLLAYSVAFAKKLSIGRILVSTDSPEYADIALKYGAECPYLRGAKAASDTAMEEEIIQDLAENLPGFGIVLPDIWLRLKPTNPFRSTSSVEQAIAALERDPSLDSVRIVSEVDARMWTINDSGYIEPFGSNWDPNRSIMRRVEFPRVYKPFNLDVFRHRGWQTGGSRFMGTRIVPIVEHKITGMDIDDESDFQIVDALISARPRPSFFDRYIHDPV